MSVRQLFVSYASPQENSYYASFTSISFLQRLIGKSRLGGESSIRYVYVFWSAFEFYRAPIRQFYKTNFNSFRLQERKLSDSDFGTECTKCRDFSAIAIEKNFLTAISLRLLNALNSEDRGLKVHFSLAMIVFETFELILCQMLSLQEKKRTFKPLSSLFSALATSRFGTGCTKCCDFSVIAIAIFWRRWKIAALFWAPKVGVCAHSRPRRDPGPTARVSLSGGCEAMCDRSCHVLSCPYISIHCKLIIRGPAKQWGFIFRGFHYMLFQSEGLPVLGRWGSGGAPAPQCFPPHADPWENSCRTAFVIFLHGMFFSARSFPSQRVSVPQQKTWLSSNISEVEVFLQNLHVARAVSWDYPFVEISGWILAFKIPLKKRIFKAWSLQSCVVRGMLVCLLRLFLHLAWPKHWEPGWAKSRDSSCRSAKESYRRNSNH